MLSAYSLEHFFIDKFELWKLFFQKHLSLDVKTTFRLQKPHCENCEKVKGEIPIFLAESQSNLCFAFEHPFVCVPDSARNLLCTLGSWAPRKKFVHFCLRVSREKISKMFPCWASFSCVFWRNVYQSALVPKSSFPSLEKFLVVYLHSDIILFTKRAILSVWQCCEFHLCPNNCSVIWTDTFRILTNSSVYFFRCRSLCSIISSVIKAYSQILRHY